MLARWVCLVNAIQLLDCRHRRVMTMQRYVWMVLYSVTIRHHLVMAGASLQARRTRALQWRPRTRRPPWRCCRRRRRRCAASQSAPPPSAARRLLRTRAPGTSSRACSASAASRRAAVRNPEDLQHTLSAARSAAFVPRFKHLEVQNFCEPGCAHRRSLSRAR